MSLNQIQDQSTGAMPIDASSAAGNGASPVNPDNGQENNPEQHNNDGLKRQLLQKLMSNLLSKPGRSVNELVNGVKDVMGAYKSYAREIDNLAGVTESPIESSGVDASGEGDGSVQSILDKIKEAKMAQDSGNTGDVNSNLPAMPLYPNYLPQAGGDSTTGQGMTPDYSNNEVPVMPQENSVPVDQNNPNGAGGPGYRQPPPVSYLGIWGF